jgi:3-isopropylmalate dehydratase small subunit
VGVTGTHGKGTVSAMITKMLDAAGREPGFIIGGLLLDYNLNARAGKGDVIVAGKNFGINSSREQAVHVMHRMGVSAIIAPSFGRQFYRNAINNGMPVIECDISGIVAGDAMEIDLAAGRIVVPAKNITRAVPPLPATVRTLLEAGGLIPFLQKHPDWNVGGEAA